MAVIRYAERHGTRRMARAADGTAHNGKAERFIQTSLREWAYVRPYASSNERTKAIHQWADNYNLARPTLSPRRHQPIP
ncbi:hypothetical protein Amn_pb01900 (plasmid) [Aminobacter sp. Y103A]|nr:hypothetical protein Amn_pb01900 [Aminobacter sp. SS-2016]